MNYTVRKGDSLSSIAQAWNVPWVEILQSNPEIKDKNKIYVGQEIIIPIWSPLIRPVTSGGARPTSNGSNPQVTGFMCMMPKTLVCPVPSSQNYSTYEVPYFGNISHENATEQKNSEEHKRDEIRKEINSSLNIQSKDDWGEIDTDYSKLEKDWNYTTIVIHHSGNGGSNDPLEIEREHMNSNDWDNVGYHYLVKRNGSIYEGTKLGYKGSHVAMANTGKIGILIMGDYHHQWWDSDDEISNIQINSTISLINELNKKFPLKTLGGHRDFKKKTVCPGDEIYNKLGDFRSKTGLNKP